MLTFKPYGKSIPNSKKANPFGLAFLVLYKMGIHPGCCSYLASAFCLRTGLKMESR